MLPLAISYRLPPPDSDRDPSFVVLFNFRTFSYSFPLSQLSIRRKIKNIYRNVPHVITK